MGEGEAAVDPLDAGDAAGASLLELQRGGAQVDDGVAAALVEDQVVAAGVPDRQVAGAGLVLRGQAVAVVAGAGLEVGAVFLLDHGDVEGGGAEVPAPGAAVGQALRRLGPAVVVGHHGVDALVEAEPLADLGHLRRAAGRVVRMGEAEAVAELVQEDREHVGAGGEQAAAGAAPVGAGVEPAHALGVAIGGVGAVHEAQRGAGAGVGLHQAEVGVGGICDLLEGQAGDGGEGVERGHRLGAGVGGPAALLGGEVDPLAVAGEMDGHVGVGEGDALVDGCQQGIGVRHGAPREPSRRQAHEGTRHSARAKVRREARARGAPDGARVGVAPGGA